MFNIVLINPEIPPNTGNIGRTCTSIGATLHLIKPLGFSIEDKAIKRSGMDFWNRLDLVVWGNLEEFLKAHPIDKRSFLATTKTDNIYFEKEFKEGDYFIFGSESTGIDEKLLLDNLEQCINIPMSKGGRSLNLSVSAGIVLYEALRQNYNNIKFEKIKKEFKV